MKRLFFLVFFLFFFFGGVTAQSSLSFTSEELSWLDDHREVRIGVDPNFLPYDGVSESGEYIGIGADYLSLLASRLNVSFVLLPNLSWSEVLDLARSGDLDVIPVIANTSKREEFLDFTVPYVSFQEVIFVREDSSGVETVADLSGKQVAMVESYATYGLLSELNPLIEPFFVASELEGLKAASLGKADAYVGFLATNVFVARENGISNLRITGDIEGSQGHFRMAVPKGDLVAISIFDKALESVSREEKDAILNRWIQIESVSSRVIPLWVKVGSGFLFVLISISAVFISLLKRKVSQLKQARENLLVYTKGFSSSPNPMVLLKSRGGEFFVEDCNSSYEGLYGRKRSVLNGKPVSVPGLADRKKMLASLSDPTKGFWIGEVTVKTSKGGSVPVRITAHSLFGAGGRPSHIIESHEDISSELESKARLERSNKVLKKNLSETEKINSFTVNRELKMVELKAEIKRLKDLLKARKDKS